MLLCFTLLLRSGSVNSEVYFWCVLFFLPAPSFRAKNQSFFRNSVVVPLQQNPGYNDPIGYFSRSLPPWDGRAHGVLRADTLWIRQTEGVTVKTASDNNDCWR